MPMWSRMCVCVCARVWCGMRACMLCVCRTCAVVKCGAGCAVWGVGARVGVVGAPSLQWPISHSRLQAFQTAFQAVIDCCGPAFGPLLDRIKSEYDATVEGRRGGRPGLSDLSPRPSGFRLSSRAMSPRTHTECVACARNARGASSSG